MTEFSLAALFTNDAWHVFEPLGAVHGATAAGCAALVATIFAASRRWRSTSGERKARLGLVTFAVAFWVFHNVWWNWNGMDLYNGLPLQICDLLGIIAPLALLTLNPWLRAVLYFWGFALSIIAFIQPTLTVGPAHLHFWLFWTAHTIILGCAAYDLAAGGWRPGWTDFTRAAIASASYLVVVVPLNAILEANYGYVGNPPPERKLPALLEAFGPWPARIGTIMAVTTLLYLLLLLPWLAVQRAARRLEYGG